MSSTHCSLYLRSRPHLHPPSFPTRRSSDLDSDATLRLKNFLAARLEESGLTKTFFDERMPLVRLYTGMDRQGVRINRPYLDELSAFFGTGLDSLRAQLAEYAENDDFNTLSHPKIG